VGTARLEHTVSTFAAYTVAVAVLCAALIATSALHLALWGTDGVRFPYPLLLVFVPLTVAHEWLHGLGFRLAGAPWSAIDFGFSVRRLTPFARCAAPLPAAGYRWSVLLPALLLGVVPAAIGLALGCFWVTVVGATMIGAAGGDLAVLWAIRAVPGPALVRDHPSKPGCLVVPVED
jgi:hypothetical protein